VVLPRVSFAEPLLQEGRLAGAQLRDELNGEVLSVQARVVVAAAGPWTDAFMASWRGPAEAAPPTLRPSKGVHVVVPRARLPLTHAVTLTSPIDGRVVFALPWPHATVIGTTDTAYEGPLDEPGCTWQDASYLIETINGCLQPVGGPLAVGDVVSTWAGIRPLVAQAGASVYKTSREHVITSDPRGLVAIAGGKLTTYRVMAQQAVDAAIELLPPEVTATLQACRTTHLPLPGATDLPSRARPLEQLEQLLVQREGLEPAVAHHLASSYGSDAAAVAARCRQEPDGWQPVLTGLPWTWGELAWLTDQEMPYDLIDLCVRRTPLYYTAGDSLLAVAGQLALRLTGWLGPAAPPPQAMVDALASYIAAHRVQPPGVEVPHG
jgi:glycerol-3-phosphate dehydrogenase